MAMQALYEWDFRGRDTARLPEIITFVKHEFGRDTDDGGYLDKQVQGILDQVKFLVVVASEGGDVLGDIAMIGPALANITSAIVAFVIPATIIVAFREIYSYAHNS